MRNIFIVFIAVLAISFTIHESKAQIVINEILASNTSTNLSEHDKNFSDWIELYNPGNKEISIGNWYLTDDKTIPTKWEIPFYYSVAPKGYKLFWLDNLNTSNHKNFKLSVEGECVYLFNKDKVLVDSIKYPLQYPNISYGRIADSLKLLKYLPEPTPLKQNFSYGFDKIELSDGPIFSKKSGFYEDSFKLELSGLNKSDKIYYTLDGTLPNKESVQYTEPISINKNTTIRARAYSENKLPGKTITQTYLLRELFTLPVFAIAIDPKYLWDKEVGFYVKGINGKELVWESTENPDLWEPANYFQEWERPINVEYFNQNKSSGFNIDAGVRIHGRSSRTYSQKSLAIFLRDKYGTSEISTKLFGEKSPEVIKSFLLRNGGNDWGMTMFLDGLVHTLVIDKIDIDAQLYQPAIVFINGEYWGIHNIREKVNKHYIKAKLPNESSKFDVIEADYMVGKLKASHGDMEEYNNMIDFVKNNKLSTKENYDTLKEWVDINELINYLVIQVYISNRDWPFSNMKFWKGRDESSKWRWVLYDTELSFKNSNEFTNFNMFEFMLAENSDIYPTPPWSNYLIRKLFENEEFKFEFIQRMAVYLHTVFDSDHVMYVLDSLKSNIEPEIGRNFNKWGGIKQKTYPNLTTCSNHAEWDANIKYIRKFIENRPSGVRQNMIEYFNIKDTVKLRLRANNTEAGEISVMGYTLKEGNFDGYVFSDVPIRIEVIPNKGYEFVEWKGEEYEQNCVISLKKNKKLTAVFKKIE